MSAASRWYAGWSSCQRARASREVAAGEVCGEVLDVDLVSAPRMRRCAPGARRGRSMTRMVWSPSAVSDTSTTPSGWSGELVRICIAVRGLAHLDAARAFPSAGEPACAELTAQAQIDLPLDARQRCFETPGIGEGRPQVIDIRRKRSSRRTTPVPLSARNEPSVRTLPGVLVVIGDSFAHACRVLSRCAGHPGGAPTAPGIDSASR